MNNRVTIETLKNAPKGAPVMMKASKDAKMLRLALKLAKEQIENLKEKA